MKKWIMFTMLTVLAIYVIIICVGARSGKLFISSGIDKSETLKSSGEQEIVSGESISSGDGKFQIGNNIDEYEDMEFNESGRIIIAMYHKFSQNEGTDEWNRSFENFYGDLKYLYDHHYRTVSLNDYLNNTMKVPVGCTPIILTFDDIPYGNASAVIS